MRIITNKLLGCTFNKCIKPIIIIVILCSCKSTKKTVQSPSNCHLDYKSSKTLSAQLKVNEFKFNWLQAKLSVDTDIDSSNTSFNVSLRIRKDSAIWMSISPALGIEVARVLITKDSVKFLNRLKTNYFKGDFNYISKLLNTELDYEILQSLLVGNSVEFYEEDEKLRAGITNCEYLLSTIRKRKRKRVIEKGKELKDPAQTIWLQDQTFKITRILFNDFNTNRTFDAYFSGFEKVDSLIFPNKINYSILAEKKINIKIEYSKIAVNKSQTFPFSIPEKYEPVIYKEK